MTQIKCSTCSKRRHASCPVRCADCEVCTIAANEFYMVTDRVWEQAWAGRRQYLPVQDSQDDAQLTFGFEPSRSANPSFSASVVCIGQRALGVADRGRWAVFESRRPPPHQSPNPRQRYTHFSLQAFRSFSGAADASAR